VPRFTAESARLAGQRSAALAKQRRADALQRAADEAKAAQAAKDAALLAALNEASTFTAQLKARTRAQTLETLSRLEEENAKGEQVDGAKLDRLASALERLAELERILDGRPGPGNRRPPREDAPSVRPAPRSLPVPRLPTPPAPAADEAIEPPAPSPRPWLSEPPDF